MKTCPRCRGSGKIADPMELGQTLKKMRIEAGITLVRMAQVMMIAQGYLSDLENGKRAWMGGTTPEMYCDALDAEIERMKQKDE